MAEAKQKKSAFIALVGRPSVGKSTLVNLLCGEKVAIVSSFPQTTRNAIRGIVTKEEGQLVFVDTPGRHVSEKKLNKKLMEVSDRALDDSELILYVVDASRIPGAEEEAIALRIAGSQKRTIVGINKTDLPAVDVRPYFQFIKEKLPEIPLERCFKISCVTREGIDALLACIFEMAGYGEAFYPEEYYTDQDISFRIAEIIREKAVNRLRQELPHSLYVEVADAELRESKTGAERQTLWVRAFIITERESQKGMVVGKGGEMIKTIRQTAQKELNRIFDWKVELDLRVKTGKDWRHNDTILRRIIDR
ncbi:MAG: GTPase Era [Treponema sp.]|jgi:GTP-binding protein Era|nr:GTPase Era [Treponema sp.]